MKKLGLFLTLALSLSIFTACGNGSKTDESKTDDSKKEKLIMATEAGFAPYEYLSNNKIVGVDIDISNEIAKELGMELEVQEVKFDGALLAVGQGKVDFVAAGCSITPKRQETMDFSKPYAKSKQVIVINKDNTSLKSGDDIKEDTRVAFQIGTTAQFYAEDSKCEAKGYTKYSQAAADLVNNKIDCIIMDDIPAKNLVKSNDKLLVLDKELFTDEYAIAVKKGNTELLEKINKVIDRLISEGKIDEFTLNHTSD